MLKLPQYSLGMIFVFILSSFFVIAQHNHVNHLSDVKDLNDLSDYFSAFDIYQEDLSDEYTFLSGNDNIQLNLSYRSQVYKLYLYKNNLLSDQYISRSAQGSQNENRAVTLNGFTQFGDIASISIADDFIFGYFVSKDGGKIYIEPARFYEKDKSDHEFVLFHEKEILDKAPGLCGTQERHDVQNRLENHRKESESSQMIVGGCLEVELAIASDFSMFQKYGSISAVENHNIGVINDVQTNYNIDFNDTLQFSIVEQFVSDCSNCDPWTSSTSANTLLSSFTNWGPTGFIATHDMGELWTNRDLDGGTVGIAWLGAVCSSNRYHVLQDFTSNANFLRVLTAHEMGHNFDATHDAAGSNTIMAPAVNNTNNWSNQSKNEINSFVGTIDPPNGCLANCPVSASPVTSDFGVVNDFICAGNSVQFFESATGPVTSYSWSFPGGIPSSSTEANPVVSYPSSGSYAVSLTVTNSAGSSDTKSTSGFMTVGFGGDAIFAFEDFENGSTGSWSVTGGQSWNINAESGVQYGNNVFRVNNFSSGGSVSLESPVLNLIGHQNPELKLNYAYATRGGTSDSLVVYISTDGGSNFQRVWGTLENGSGNYATAPNTSVSFSPADSEDWCHGTANTCLSIPLAGASHQPNLVVKVQNKALGGNNLYIDYLYVASDCYDLNPPIADFSADVVQGCDNLTVNFQDESLENPSNWSWSFPGGTPASSTEQNPTVYYSQPGLYSVQLSVSNPEGSDSETKNDYIYVEEVPVAFFTTSVSGKDVDFTNETTPNANSFLWDFDDGNTSTQNNPSHTYAQDGIYTVELTASNICGSDTYSEDVEIATLPVAEFTVSDSMGCEPLEVLFDASPTQNATSYTWEFPGGTPSSSINSFETVIYDSAGTFDVMLVASNSVGNDTLLLENHIVISALPVADFYSVENFLTVEFFSNALFTDSLIWTFGDGNTSNEVDPVHTYQSEGTYDVELITINDCGTDTFTQSITVEEQVLATVTANTSEGCRPLDVDFSASSSTGASNFAWTFQGGSPGTSAQENVTVTYDQAGTFDVTLIVSDGIVSDTMFLDDYITVEEGPSGSFDQSISGREVSFTATVNLADSFYWDFGDGNFSSTLNPTHTYDADGTYEVTLLLLNNCDTVSVLNTVTIATPPTAGFTIDQMEGCIPLEVNFSNTSSENAHSYAWTFEGGTPGTSTMENPSITYNTAGVFGVKLIAISDGGMDTIQMDSLITVQPDPAPDFQFTVDTLTVVFSNQSEHSNAYLWEFGDGETSTEENPTHTYDQEGSYTVTLTAYNDCDTNSFTREIGTASLPQANFTVQGNASGCAPFTVQFESTSGGTVDSFFWTFEGGNPSTSNVENPQVTYNNKGRFDVTLRVVNSAGDNELIRQEFIDVNETATGSVDVEVVDSLTVRFEGAVFGDSSATVEWQFGDGSTSNQENVIYTYGSSGTYEVLFITENECGADTSVTQVRVGSTSVTDNPLQGITLYPNPAQAQFNIDGLKAGSILRVLDQFGHTIMTRDIMTERISVPTIEWLSGIYYVQIYYKGEISVRKVVIQD